MYTFSTYETKNNLKIEWNVRINLKIEWNVRICIQHVTDQKKSKLASFVMRINKNIKVTLRLKSQGYIII